MATLRSHARMRVGEAMKVPGGDAVKQPSHTAPSSSCPHLNECPGCPAFEVSEEKALERKREGLAQAIRRFDQLAHLVIPQVERIGEGLGYRVRSKWVVDREGRVGLYAAGSHRVVDIVECPVLRPTLMRVARSLRKKIGHHPALHPEFLVGIDLREAVGDGVGVMVTLTCRKGNVPSEETLNDLEEQLRNEIEKESSSIRIDRLLVSAAEHDDSPRTLGVYRFDKQKVMWDRIGDGPPFLVAPGSFTQVHREVAAAIHERITSLLKSFGQGALLRVVELFAGSGGLGLRLAKEGFQVVAVERFLPAALLARESAHKLGVEGYFEMHACDVREATALLRAADVLLINPPRAGLPAEVREAIARSTARAVALLYCDPETLARDLAALKVKGFETKALFAFDMMPKTFEVEALAWLERGSLPPPRALAQGKVGRGQWLVVEKFPHEPTVPHPEWGNSLLERVRGFPGFERAIPVHRLDAETSGCVLFASGPEEVEPLSKALAAGTKRYLALVRGIPHAKGVIRRPIVHKGVVLPATTRYCRLEVIGGHGLLEIRPEQGRTHQIRKHLAAIGQAIVGDKRYGHLPTNQRFQSLFALDRLFLHCARIELEIDGNVIEVSSPLPPDLVLVLDRLKAHG
ncbi:MAG: pseudouridine synthase [Sandaracinaceae bacterium]|nr:pseudouridine synthase [Sandaracinaceae bacterium]